MNEYYYLPEMELSRAQHKKRMLALIRKDKDFYDAYLCAA